MIKVLYIFLIILNSHNYIFSQERNIESENFYKHIAEIRNLEDCFNIFDDCINEEERKKIINIEEDDFVSTAYIMGLGSFIKNDIGVWRSTNIHLFFREKGIFHPDDMTAIILTSYYRYLKRKKIKLNQQIRFYKRYWKRMEKNELERKRSDMSFYKVKDTVYFTYNNGFISKTQEEKYKNKSCVAKGIIRDRNKKDFLLQIELIEVCDEKGIIISKENIYKKGTWIVKETKNIKIIHEGDIRWIYFELWNFYD